jgi:uncharacterized membrane protein
MADSQDELAILRAQVQSLTARVHRLEERIAPEAPAVAAQVTVRDAAPPKPASPISPPTMPTIQRPAPQLPVIPPPSLAATEPPRDSADLEGQIGKFWLNRIGIVAVLIGAAYFLQLAIQNQWIGPSGQVGLGLVAGIAVVVWSESFRKKNYTAFSYSLKAVGIGILYLSLWAASQYYHLIPVAAAFVAMIVVTASTIAMALSQDAELLAFYAQIGGFSTPLLVSTGQNHEAVLFSYVALMDLAVLALASFKPWRRLFWSSFVGTAILYAGWFSTYYSDDQRTLTVLFTLGLGAIFAAIPVVTPHEESRLYKGTSVTLTLLPFLNAGAMFLCLFVMYESEKATLTWYALGLAAGYLLLASLFRYRTAAPTKSTTVIHLLHVAIAIVFITIAIPLKLNEHWITIGWLVESAALLWIAVRTQSDLVRIFAGCTLTLAIFRLVIIDSYQTNQLLLNARFLTSLIAIAILGGIVWAGERYAYQQEMPLIHMAAVVLNLLALWTLTLEARDYFSRQSSAANYATLYHQLQLGRDFSYSAIWLMYGAALMAVGFWKKSAFVRWQALALIAFTIGKVFIYDTAELDRVYRILSFIALGVVLMGISFVYQRDWLKLSSRGAGKSATPGHSA